MVAGRRHRGARAPRVRGRVVFLHIAQGSLRLTRTDRRSARVECRSCATDHIDFPTHDSRHAGSARGRHRGQRPPAVRHRIVFPGIVDRVPARRPRRRKVEAPEQVHLSVRDCDRRVVHRMGHRFLLRPPIAGRIVFVHEAGWFESGQEPLRSVEPSVDRTPEQFSGCLWKRGELDPLSLWRSRWGARCGRRGCGLRAKAHAVESPHQPLAGGGRHESQAGGHEASPAHAALLSVQAVRSRRPPMWTMNLRCHLDSSKRTLRSAWRGRCPIFRPRVRGGVRGARIFLSPKYAAGRTPSRFPRAS